MLKTLQHCKFTKFVNFTSTMESLILALSLCADCFAVCLCSSIGLNKSKKRTIFLISTIFAIIQSGLFMLGWAFGYAFVGLMATISNWVGFLLLLYVGASMLVEGVRGKSDCRNLNGLKNIILGGIATSIDASAVGVAKSMNGTLTADAIELGIYVFVCTFCLAYTGILVGKALGCSRRLGRIAEIAGGIVLIIIGLRILL